MSSQMIHRIAKCSVRTFGLLRISPRISRLRPYSSTSSPTPVETSKTDPQKVGAQSMSSKTHKVDGIERRMLVWTGKYKNVDEIPSYINQDVMEKARNKIRIRLANIMMALTAIACLFMVYSGKQAAERGETVQKLNMDWHKEYNEQSVAEAKAQNQKSK